jgi:hypothetical protein
MPDPNKPADLVKAAPSPPPAPAPAAPVAAPAATRAGSKAHLQKDAKFRVVHPCALSCHPGDLVGRSQLRPRASMSGDAAEEATNEVIERLMEFGAIVHEPQD